MIFAAIATVTIRRPSGQTVYVTLKQRDIVGRPLPDWDIVGTENHEDSSEVELTHEEMDQAETLAQEWVEAEAEWKQPRRRAQ
mgnify:CR=1 FL=1